MSDLPLLCRLGLHTDVVFYNEGSVYRPGYYTRGEPYTWPWALCHKCDQRLMPTRKIRKRQAEIEAEVVRIRKEIEIHGHPLLTGVTI